MLRLQDICEALVRGLTRSSQRAKLLSMSRQSRQFFRFLSDSLLAFETRLDHQVPTRLTVKLHFEKTEIDCCLYDCVITQTDGPALFRGLGIDVYAGESGNKIPRVEPFCARWLGLLSYSQMSPCGPAKLECTYDWREESPGDCV
jgi:hypothetical protein